MPESEVFMPDGNPFVFWDDATSYGRVYHVACEHPDASDDGPGTEAQPFATIGAAAQLVCPGEKVIVHGGTYRECVRPARGGESPERMIAYESAEGEDVRVWGAEHWAPEFAASDGWNFGELPEGVTVWTGAFPPEWFIGYNPFMTANFSSEYTTFTKDWTDEETHRFMLKRGMVFADGRPLKQVFRARDLAEADGVFWVEDPGLRIHFRLWDDADPKDASFEVVTREQVFAPAEAGLGYIRIAGFHFEYAADGVPIPQRALVSAARGHHWIVEDNEIRWANGCGLDVGNETWHRIRLDTPGESGCHIIRRNRVSHCGTCGIAAIGNNNFSLVEDNFVEYIGHNDLERVWEAGGLKFHLCDTVLIRRNAFRHLRHAPGVWLDCMNRNCRITENVFADIHVTPGALYMEVSQHLNVMDHNIVWDVRGPKEIQGHAVNVDTGEKCVVAHNLLGKLVEGYGIAVHTGQRERVVGKRYGLGMGHKLLNNIFAECPKRILFSRTAKNCCDGNLFDERDDRTSFCIQYPDPQVLVDLEGWQEYFEFDTHGRQAKIEIDFDPEELTLSVKVEGELPECVEVEELHEGGPPKSPGPVDITQQRVYGVGPIPKDGRR